MEGNVIGYSMKRIRIMRRGRSSAASSIGTRCRRRADVDAVRDGQRKMLEYCRGRNGVYVLSRREKLRRKRCGVVLRPRGRLCPLKAQSQSEGVRGLFDRITETLWNSPRKQSEEMHYSNASAPENDDDSEEAVVSNVIGIDLGTTNSAVAVLNLKSSGNELLSHPLLYTAEDVLVLKDKDSGEMLLPSIVSYAPDIDSNMRIIVGKREPYNYDPINTFSSVKRIIGRQYDDHEAQDEIERMAITASKFKESKNTNQDLLLHVPSLQTTVKPQQVSAEVLKKLKSRAEAYFEDKVTHAVITVPANFNESQMDATKDAAKEAGLEILRMLREPTAAAIAYGYGRELSDRDLKVLVFDMGGGTLDVSLLDIGGGVFEVLGSSGDTRLGGDDFDKLLVDWIVEENLSSQADPRLDPAKLHVLMSYAEKIKCRLSHEDTISIPLPDDIAQDSKASIIHITKEEFDKRSIALIQRCRRIIEKAISKATDEEGKPLTKHDIDEIILVGGSTMIPSIKNMVLQYVGKEPRSDVDPMLVVAIGAAIQAATLSGQVERTSLINLDEDPDLFDLAMYSESFATLIDKLSSNVDREKDKEF